MSSYTPAEAALASTENRQSTTPNDRSTNGGTHVSGGRAIMLPNASGTATGTQSVHYSGGHPGHSAFGGHSGVPNMMPDNLGPMGANGMSSVGGYDGSMMFAGYPAPMQAPYGMAMAPIPEGMYPGPMSGGQYMHHGPVLGPYAPYATIPFTPSRSASYAERSDRDIRDLPALDNRRASYSTAGTTSTPSTPYFNDRHQGMRVISGDRSTYTTPSPQQMGGSGHQLGHYAPKGKRWAEAELRALLAQEPAVPQAVPAVFTADSQRKNIDESLINLLEGIRIVYIRGLHPTTDDELLLNYASRLGEVEQTKAIIDEATGACKGFGFAKFKDVRDSEKCIQAFFHLGYEVGFARPSFNARLKAEGDENSTNLYVSNLPRTVTEAQLAALFAPYEILSSKILRDSIGNSRGVGFARFTSRDVCDDVIDRFNCQPIEEHSFLMQVRYADTSRQKELKRITAERREFRTKEYNLGAYGTTNVIPSAPYANGQGTWTASSRLGSGVQGAASLANDDVEKKTEQVARTAVHTPSNVSVSDEEDGAPAVESPTLTTRMVKASLKQESTA